MSLQSIVIGGNLTGAPELRFSATGTAVASFSIATTERFLDRQSGEYKDGSTHFQRCVAFGRMAEHIAASVNRGSAVLVVGRLVTDEYEHTDKETGEKSNRRSVQLRCEDFAVSLRWAEVTIRRAQRAATPSAAPDSNGSDPWAPAPAMAGAPAEPPF